MTGPTSRDHAHLTDAEREDAGHVRDGHTLNLHLGTNEVWLTANCPHDHIDWSAVPPSDRPGCRWSADQHDGTPDAGCVIAGWPDSVIGAAELLHLGDNSFTATQLPVEVEYWWDGGDPYLAPIEKPPGRDEYTAMVEAYRSPGREA